MNAPAWKTSACPYDCPDGCAMRGRFESYDSKTLVKCGPRRADKQIGAIDRKMHARTIKPANK